MNDEEKTVSMMMNDPVAAYSAYLTMNDDEKGRLFLTLALAFRSLSIASAKMEKSFGLMKLREVGYKASCESYLSAVDEMRKELSKKNNEISGLKVLLGKES